MVTKIIYPIYFLPVERKGTTWYFEYGEVFYNHHNTPVPEYDRERLFGLTRKIMIVELFRVAGGKAGYYLANMRDKKYYYCGPNWEDVGLKLKELGIGRDEPNYPQVD